MGDRYTMRSCVDCNTTLVQVREWFQRMTQALPATEARTIARDYWKKAADKAEGEREALGHTCFILKGYSKREGA